MNTSGNRGERVNIGQEKSTGDPDLAAQRWITLVQRVRKILPAAFTLAFALQAPLGRAQTPLASEDAYLQELPVVLTASRLAQRQSEAPNAITVIDRKMIDASGFRTIPELLRLVPGMYVGFADANRPVVSLHGSVDEFARRMQVLVDGRSVFMPPFGSVSWEDLPVLFEDIDRIEVVRGPSSASHGSNAFYGTINIITLDPRGENSGRVSVRAGAASDASARIQRSQDDWDYGVSLGYRSDDGLEHGILNDYSATRLYGLRLNVRPTHRDEIQVQIGGTRGIYGLGIVDRPEDAFRETSTASDFGSVSWHRIWSERDESKLTLSHSALTNVDPKLCKDSNVCQYQSRLPFLYPLSLYPTGGFFAQINQAERSELELQNSHQISDNHRVVWGGGMRRDFADYSIFLEEPTSVHVWRLFAHDEWRVSDQLIMNAGVMHENDGVGNTNNSPRVSLNYHLNPQNTLRLAWSAATRSPVMSETFIKATNTVLGGLFVRPLTQLTPEKIESREIGYVSEFPDLHASLDLRLYQERVTDQIWYDKFVVITPDPYNRSSPDSFKNLFATEFNGIELTLKRQWDGGRSFVAANYAYQEASASLSSLPTQYNSTAPFAGFSSWGGALQWYYQSQYLDLYPQYVPKHTLSLLISQTMPDRWQLSAGYYYRTQVRVGDVGTDVSPETLMRRLDLKIAKSLRWGDGVSGVWSLVIQNATRDSYTKYGTLQVTAEVPFERRAWAGLDLNF